MNAPHLHQRYAPPVEFWSMEDLHQDGRDEGARDDINLWTHGLIERTEEKGTAWAGGESLFESILEERR